MRVPEGVHAQAGHEVEIAFAPGVVDKHSLAPAQHHRIAIVGLQKKLALALCDLVKSAHRNDLILPEVRLSGPPAHRGRINE